PVDGCIDTAGNNRTLLLRMHLDISRGQSLVINCNFVDKAGEIPVNAPTYCMRGIDMGPWRSQACADQDAIHINTGPFIQIHDCYMGPLAGADSATVDRQR